MLGLSTAGALGLRGPAGPQGDVGRSGDAGASAYEIAVATGFAGTESDWLASLRGADGAAGPAGADGAPGAAGPAGADGASAYEIALAAGFDGTEAEWLASLRGADGAPGPQGAAGDPGAVGASAYDVAVAAGFVGTEAEWLSSLRGADGAAGPAGAGGAQGPAGPGIAEGGEIGQFLRKTSADDFATGWYTLETVPPGGVGLYLTRAADGTLSWGSAPWGGLLFSGEADIYSGATFNSGEISIGQWTDLDDIGSETHALAYSKIEPGKISLTRKIFDEDMQQMVSAPAEPVLPSHVVTKSYVDRVAQNSAGATGVSLALVIAMS